MPRSLYRRNLLWELENVTVLKKCAERAPVRSGLPIFRATGAKALLLIAAILVEAPVVSQPLQAQESAAFATQVQQLIDQTKWESALWGIHIISLKDGRV